MSYILTAAEWDILRSKTFSCQLGLRTFEKRNVLVSVEKSSFDGERLMFAIDPDSSSKGKVAFIYYPTDGCYFDPARLVFLFEFKRDQRVCTPRLIKYCNENCDLRKAKTLLKDDEFEILRVLFDSDGISVEFLPLLMRALGWKGEPMSHEMAYKAFPNDVRKPFSPYLMKSEDQSNMLKFYQDGTLTDFVLVSSDKQEIKVHRVKIAAVSEVFLNMLSHNTVENREGICHIADIDYGTLKLMVDAFYGLPVDEESMKEYCWKLCTAANEYQLLELQTSCLHYMEDKMGISPSYTLPRHLLSIANVVEVFKVAKECEDEQLVKTAVKFVRNNYEAFIDSDGFIDVVEKIPDYSKEFFKLVSVDLVEKRANTS